MSWWAPNLNSIERERRPTKRGPLVRVRWLLWHTLVLLDHLRQLCSDFPNSPASTLQATKQAAKEIQKPKTHSEQDGSSASSWSRASQNWQHTLRQDMCSGTLKEMTSNDMGAVNPVNI